MTAAQLELDAGGPDRESADRTAGGLELGSRWYVFGDHFEILEATELDGEPAVRLRRLRDGKRLRVRFLAAPIERHGVPSEAGR